MITDDPLMGWLLIFAVFCGALVIGELLQRAMRRAFRRDRWRL